MQVLKQYQQIITKRNFPTNTRALPLSKGPTSLPVNAIDLGVIKPTFFHWQLFRSVQTQVQKKTNNKQPTNVDLNQCNGCGSKLQSHDPTALGYIVPNAQRKVYNKSNKHLMLLFREPTTSYPTTNQRKTLPICLI